MKDITRQAFRLPKGIALFMLTFALFGADVFAAKKTIVRGHVSDYKESSLQLTYQPYRILSNRSTLNVPVAEDGTFVCELLLEGPTWAFVSMGKYPGKEIFTVTKADGQDTTMTTDVNHFPTVYLYLLPGDKLELRVSASDVSKSLQLIGKNSANSLFLNEEDWRFNNYGEKHLKNYYGYVNYDEAMYKEYVYKRKQDREAFLEEFIKDRKVSKELVRVARQTIASDAVIALISYPAMRSTYIKQEYIAPGSYYRFMDSVVLDYSSMDNGLNYYNSLDLYLKTRHRLDKPNTDYFDYVASVLPKRLWYSYSAWALGSNFKKRLYDLFGPDCPYPQLAREVKAKYKKLEAMLEGNPAPPIVFYDLEGKQLKFPDLKGKLLYLDFWATWCGPCIAEMPALKALQEKYEDEDILFVSISIDKEKDKQKWMDFVQQKKLTGVQVWMDEANNAVMRDAFNMSQIPRFVLLDREGKIIDANAPRPSDLKLIQLIDKAL